MIRKCIVCGEPIPKNRRRFCSKKCSNYYSGFIYSILSQLLRGRNRISQEYAEEKARRKFYNPDVVILKIEEAFAKPV